MFDWDQLDDHESIHGYIDDGGCSASISCISPAGDHTYSDSVLDSVTDLDMYDVSKTGHTDPHDHVFASHEELAQGQTPANLQY